MQFCPFFKYAIALLAFFGSFLIPFSSQGQTSEFRGVWVDAWGAGFYNSTQVASLVNHCRTYNFNAVVVQMRRRGDAFYMPQAPNLEPRFTSPSFASNFDALQEIINQCHNATPRIEVHCWIPTFLVGDSSSPNNPNHVMNLRPDLMMKNSSGQIHIGEGYYLDPGNPGAQTWNFNVAKDIVSRYNIDGFHWDYIRYPTTDSGFNDVAVARYNAEYGLTGQPAFNDTQFANWRRRQVTEFLRWANAELLGIKPNLIISASVFASRTDAFNARYQDWAAWNNEGIIDLCMPMNYTADNPTFNSRATDAFNNQGVRWVYVGPGAYLNTKENTLTQLNYVRSKPFKGSVLYSYRVPNSGTVNQTATFTYLRDNYQPTWVPTPTLPWKTNPTKGIIKGTVMPQGSTNPIYNATITLSGASSRTQKTGGNGKYAFFETTPGNYTVTASSPGMNAMSNSVSLAAGQILTVNFTISTNDSTAPVISGIQVKSVTDVSATISWVTDEAANSVVDYGPTISYGSIVSNAAFVVTRDITLTGLNPDTTYNFRVRSKDPSNNQAISGNATFKTNPSGVVSDVIVQSRQANGALTPSPLYSESGTFANSTLKSSASPLSGSTNQGSRFASSGTPAFSVTPTLPVAGAMYDVYLTHGVATSISDDLVVAVSQTGGTGLPATTTIFREPGGNTWELLGRITLNSGISTPTLTFTRSSGALSSSDRMYADAVKFVYIPTPPTITAHPQNRTSIAGTSANFTVTAQGPSPTYQWLFNGSPISGATNSSYTRSPVQLAHAGNYSVVVSNRDGTITSSAAVLTVNFALSRFTSAGGTMSSMPDASSYPPESFVTLTAHPLPGYSFVGWQGSATGTDNPMTILMLANQNITANFVSDISDIIVDNPSAVLTGTWTTSTAPDDYGSNYIYASTTTSGTPNSTATFHPQITMAGRYDIYVWHPLGTTPTLNGHYQVSDTSGVSSFALDQNVASGTWRLLATARPFAAGTNGFVRVANNTGEAGRRISADAIKLVYSTTQEGPPVVIGQPQSSAVRVGDEAMFNVVASGSSPFTYQWKFQNSNIAGATRNILLLTDVQSSNFGDYSVVVSNALGSATSGVATLGLVPPSEPAFHSLEILPSNELRFVIDGEPGYSFTVEVSTNLTHWTTLTNITSESGSVEVTDSVSSNHVQRFYRSRWNE